MAGMLRRLSRAEWMNIAFIVLFIALQVWLDLELPGYMALITTLVQTPGSALADIWTAGVFMLLCAVGSVAAAVVVGFLASRVSASFSMRLRSSLFDRVLSFSMHEISSFSTASLITRSTNDVNQVRMLLGMGLQVIIRAPLLGFWAISKIAGKSWQWTTATAIAVALLLALASIIITVAVPRFRRIQQLTDNLNRVTRENLTGLRVIRAHNAQNLVEEKFARANQELTDTNLFVHRIMAVIAPAMSLMMGGLTLIIYWLGALIIDSAAMTDRLPLFSDMVVFSSYAMQVVFSFMMLTMLFVVLPRAAVSARRINEVLGTESSVIDGPMTATPALRGGRVEFRNVSFRYPGADEYVLRDVSFTAEAGQTVAIVGSTGSGKSTLVNLLVRFHDPTEGQILLNGVDIKSLALHSLRDRLGYVPQKAVILGGTVRSNLTLGQVTGGGLGDDALQRALEIAQAADFVAEMPSGVDSDIAQAGANISGGQKQRLAIARAIARNAEVYIFDDSFSALDYRTERRLRTAMQGVAGQATCLNVAQRIGSIRDADLIVVLEQGRLAGKGTHRELLRSSAVYREIAQSQLAKEDLAHG